MQSVGTDYEVEVPRLAMIERDVDATVVVVDGGDAVAEDRLDVVLDSGVDRGRQVAARQAGEVVADHASKDVDAQLRFGLAAGPDGADALHVIARIKDL